MMHGLLGYERDSLHMVCCLTDLLMIVQSEVAKVVESQHSLERQLELIETHQQQVCSIVKHLGNHIIVYQSLKLIFL